jgi:hypothetical protein
MSEKVWEYSDISVNKIGGFIDSVCSQIRRYSEYPQRTTFTDHERTMLHPELSNLTDTVWQIVLVVLCERKSRA